MCRILSIQDINLMNLLVFGRILMSNILGIDMHNYFLESP
jgi:hypothetical protein